MHCAHFSFDLLGPHKGFLDLTECAHVHEFRKNLLTEFTVYLKIAKCSFSGPSDRAPSHGEPVSLCCTDPVKGVPSVDAEG